MGPHNLPRLAQRFFNVPLAITPGKIEVIMAALAGHFGLESVLRVDTGETVMLSSFNLEEEERASSKVYEVVEGIAIIPIEGTLVQKSGYIGAWSGITGYDGIRAQFLAAQRDPDVRAIVFDCDSPGGEVAGCFDLVDTIYDARGDKPMWSILSESAYSACYAIASAADRIIVPRTGGTGSVGVICACVDLSRALDQQGIKVELITYGKHKADGNEFIQLSAAARARFQADVDTMGDLFVETVSRNLSMATAKVRDTQALTYMGKAGVDVGFAHAVMSPDQAFRALLTELG